MTDFKQQLLDTLLGTPTRTSGAYLVVGTMEYDETDPEEDYDTYHAYRYYDQDDRGDALTDAMRQYDLMVDQGFSIVSVAEVITSTDYF